MCLQEKNQILGRVLQLEGGFHANVDYVPVTALPEVYDLLFIYYI